METTIDYQVVTLFPTGLEDTVIHFHTLEAMEAQELRCRALKVAYRSRIVTTQYLK